MRARCLRWKMHGGYGSNSGPLSDHRRSTTSDTDLSCRRAAVDTSVVIGEACPKVRCDGVMQPVDL